MEKKRGLWLTMSVHNIVSIFQILRWLNERGVLEEGKGESYFGSTLTPEDFMEYAQEIADNDELWNKLPDSWETDTVATLKQQALTAKAFNLDFKPSDTMTLDKAWLRQDLRLTLAICDNSVIMRENRNN